MPVDKDNEPRNESGELFGWWRDQIANLAGVVPQAGSSSAGDGRGELPFPAGQLAQALQLTQQLIGPLYQGYVQALLTNPNAGEAFVSLQDMLRTQMQSVSDALGAVAPGLGSAQTILSDGWGLMTAPMKMFGQAVAPLSLNLERAYGGLADAFGLAPSRELQGAARELAAASLGKQQAQAQYMSIVAAALAKGNEGLLAELRAMGDRGESVDSLLKLVRLWARALDQSMHAAMQAPEALEASAKLVRAGSRARLQKQRMVAIASEALNIPTRAEVDDAYREIQELKRQIRKLRKPAQAAAPTVSSKASSSIALAAPKPTPKPAAVKRTRSLPAAAKRAKSTRVKA
ncbi:poly(R)-hydroxyalkanoic acid synthase subunit PhaE [Variovorax sp. J22R133]|uniref:poly(R)-hydroxyalkanoic acid synthase subunit PhaE n=1 Tax=Variovorax brevis TaxID=3053503 RepID=UPI0025770790|nr:poly(R)-hydroxyalkanoic acid synthase subunit PhaE [Variovorax sp. J22R133]MDM0117042.1 poly(R)-hydroxyalkanoic acid synthase subunit PhaE [Variovorax sp. J22R133]